MSEKLYNRLASTVVTIALAIALNKQDAPGWAVTGFCVLCLPVFIMFMNSKEE